MYRYNRAYFYLFIFVKKLGRGYTSILARTLSSVSSPQAPLPAPISPPAPLDHMRKCDGKHKVDKKNGD